MTSASISSDEKPLAAAPISAMHVRLILVCAFALCFDLAESTLGNTLSSIFSAAPYRLSSGTLGWLLAASYIGAIIGAGATGWLADRYGRRLVLSGIFILLAASSAAAGSSPNIGWLIFARGLSGVALGSCPALVVAYLTDVLPPRRLASLNMVAAGLGYLGPPLMTLGVRHFLPIQPLGFEAWRWAFWVGAAGAAVCALLFRYVPESPQWLAARGLVDRAQESYARFAVEGAPSLAPSGTVADDASPTGQATLLRRRLGLLMIAYFLTPWATMGFTILSGTVLVQKGVRVEDSLLYVAVSQFGPIAGVVIGGFIVDAAGGKWSLIGSAVVLMLFGLAFAVAPTPIWMMISGVGFSIVVAMFLPIMMVYAAEQFPAEQRARATTLAWMSTRVGSALVPLLLLPLLRTAGPIAMFTLSGGLLILFALLIWRYGPDLRPSHRLPQPA